MKVLIFALITIGTLSVCQCIEVVNRPGKGAEYCQEICLSCGGPSFTENSVCYCYVEKGVDVKQCVDNAWKKSSKYNMDWVPIHAPGRIARKARPVRGSFLDPIVANVFEKNPTPSNNLMENFVHKSPHQKLFKRSLKKDLSAQELADLYNYAEENFYQRKRRVPRSLAVSEKKILGSEEDSGEFFIKKKLMPGGYFGSASKRREKRNIPYQTFPKFDVSRPNMYEILLEYPSSRDEEDKIQLLFPNTNGLDIEHEYYVDDGSDENNDDFDAIDDDDNSPASTWNRMSSNYNPLQSLFAHQQGYTSDPDIRASRSLYLIPEPLANGFPYPYMMTYCRHA